MIKRKRLLLLPIFLLLFVAWRVNITTHAVPPIRAVNPPLPTSTPTQPALRQDAEVVAVMQSLGLDYSKLNLIYGNDDLMNAKADTLATFTTPNIIHISPNADSHRLLNAVSHEYIHYVQYQNEASAQSFYPYLESLQQSDTWLYGRLAYYRQSGTCVSTDGNCLDKESEAIACTEMPDYALHPDFVAWCNKYLPKRYSLPL